MPEGVTKTEAKPEGPLTRRFREAEEAEAKTKAEEAKTKAKKILESAPGGLTPVTEERIKRETGMSVPKILKETSSDEGSRDQSSQKGS